MSRFAVILFVGLFLSVSAAWSDADRRGGDSSQKQAGRRVSDMLESYNLPEGLFPTDVISSFTFDEADGSFEMKLDRSCYVKLEDEYLWYGETIKGKIRPGRIEDLNGVQARELLVWLGVKGLHVDDVETGYVYLEIGLSYTRLSAQRFQEPPACSTEEAGPLFVRIFQVL